jgi:6-phosphogluconolactonase
LACTQAPPPPPSVPSAHIARRPGAAQGWAAASPASGTLHIAVAGGSLLTTLVAAVRSDPSGVAASRWRVWYVDERCVPHASPDSNHGGLVAALAAAGLTGALALEPADTDLAAEACARDYSDRIAAAVPAGPTGVPQFDLVLAGMGEDGHVASLFPGHALLAAPATAPWVLHLSDSPKPPPTRVTVTMPVLAAARAVAFVAAGAGKADPLAAILGGLLGPRRASLRGSAGGIVAGTAISAAAPTSSEGGSGGGGAGGFGADAASRAAALAFPSGAVTAGAAPRHLVHWIVDDAAVSKWG